MIPTILGFSKEPLPKIEPFRADSLPPLATLHGPQSDGALTIRLENRGAGIGKIQVSLNGTEVHADARGASLDPKAAKEEIALDFAKSPLLKPGRKNDAEVLAWNAAGDISGLPIRWSFVAKGEPAVVQPPPQLMVNAGHAGITSVAITKDSRFVLTTGGDATAIVWEASTGRVVRRIARHHGDSSIAFFSSDDREIVTARSNAIRFDFETGSELQSSRCWIAPFGYDHAWTVGGEGGTEVKVFDIRSFAPLRILRSPGKDRIGNNVVVISPGGKMVAASSSDHSIRVWEVNGREQKPLLGHTGRLYSFQFSRDDALGVSTSEDKTVRLWDIASGKELWRGEGERFDDNLASAVFSPDGRMVAVARFAWTELRDVTTGKIVDRIRFDAGPRAFTADGRYLLLGNRHHGMRYAAMWDLAKKQEVRRFASHTSAVTSASLSSDMRRLLTRTGKQAVVWDLVSGREHLRLDRPPTYDYAHTKFIDDGKKMLISGGGVQLADAETGAAIASTTEIAACMAISPDETLLAGIPQNGHTSIVVVRNLRTQKEVFRRDFKGTFPAIAFTPDGKRLLVGNAYGLICCLDTERLKSFGP
ncbi:MAG: hypothetical protein U0744_20940 [Gemmataceae bacterium]